MITDYDVNEISNRMCSQMIYEIDKVVLSKLDSKDSNNFKDIVDGLYGRPDCFKV